MARLVDLNTDTIGEVDDNDIYDYLRSGRYDFADEETAIHVTDKEDPEGLGIANFMSREDAKRYVLQGAGSYMNEKAVSEYRTKRDYGNREGTAAALGAAGALSVGVIPAIAGLVSDEAAGIMDANPGWMLGSDILTTIAALALSPATGGATGAAGAPAMARLLAKTPMGKKGAESLLKSAGKLAKHLPPHLVDKFGKGVQTKMGMKLLGEAAEEQLKKSGVRGLAARMGGMGAEALVYSAGYSLHDVVKDYKKDREWGEIATNYLYNVGVGTGLGLAIPGVFLGAPIAAAGIAKGGKKLASMPINWVFDSKAADNALDAIAKGHDNMYVESQFGKAADQINIKQTFQELRNREGAHKQAAIFATKLDDMVSRTTNFMGRATEFQKEIRKYSDLGHAKSTVSEAIGISEKFKGQPGEASTIVMLEKLLNGNFTFNNTSVSRGLLDVLRNDTLEFLRKGDRTLSIDLGGMDGTGSFEEVIRIGQQGQDELRAIVREIDGIRDFSSKFIKRLLGTDAHSIGKKWMDKGTKEGAARAENLRQHLSRLPDYDIDGITIDNQLVAVAMNIPEIRNNIFSDFNAEVFVRLERLSERVHRMIPGGLLTPDPASEHFVKKMADQINQQFLTEKGEVWGKEISGGLSMFGKMSDHKRRANTLLRKRQAGHDKVMSKFSEVTPGFPDAREISPGKVEGTLRTLHHENSERQLRVFEEYVDSNIELLKWFKGNANFSGGKSDPWKKDIAIQLAEAIKMKNQIMEVNSYVKRNIGKAMRWSAVLDSEAKQAMTLGNRGLIPYIGTGALASGLGYAVAGPVGGALAGTASLAGRYAYDLMSTPGRALANMQKFFAASDAFDDFIGGQVERYFLWLNRAKKGVTKEMKEAAKARAPETNWKSAEDYDLSDLVNHSPLDRMVSGRLMYTGPGSESTGRFPSVLSSRFIAQYVTGEED